MKHSFSPCPVDFNKAQVQSFSELFLCGLLATLIKKSRSESGNFVSLRKHMWHIC